MMKRLFTGKIKWVSFGILFIGMIFGLGAVVMWLWNAILPDAVAVIKPINYWQALGLLVLSKILFSGFGKGKHRGGNAPFARHEMKQKFMEMSDEERAAFKEKWKNRCQ